MDGCELHNLKHSFMIQNVLLTLRKLETLLQDILIKNFNRSRAKAVRTDINHKIIIKSPETILI